MPVEVVRFDPEPGSGKIASVNQDVIVLVELVRKQVCCPWSVAAKRLGDVDDTLGNIRSGRKGFRRSGRLCWG